jgi:sec-independent protein translocase protein TatA
MERMVGARGGGEELPAMGELFSNPLHLMLLIVVIVLLFGASKLGDVGGALGKSIREFKKEAGKDDEAGHGRKVTPPPAAASYVPPTQPYQATATTPPAAPVTGYAAPEPPRVPEYAPSDYRPATPPTPPQAGAGAPPDFSGR